MDHKIKKQWRKIIMKSNIDSEEIPIKLKKKKLPRLIQKKKKIKHRLSRSRIKEGTLLQILKHYNNKDIL